MQENWLEIMSNFNAQQCFVLATVIATRGATYRKSGTMMLINENGQCTGLLSGGCLEADIALHAKMVLESGTTKVLNYDLKADAELLWGLGLGCDGAIDILLQPLTPQNNHLEFNHLLNALRARRAGYFQQTLVPHVMPSGAFYEHGNLPSSDEQGEGTSLPIVLNSESKTLSIRVTPPLSIVIFGAGPDAEPLVSMMHQMGWQVSLIDHRQKYLNQPCFEHCNIKIKSRANKLTSEQLVQFDGGVVMSHNLDNDALFLKALLQANLSYIGLLGPQNRKLKLFDKIKQDINQVNHKVYGPIGLPLGGRSPQAIALSIVSEIQQHFMANRGVKQA